MKNLLFILSILTLPLVTVSCTKEEEPILTITQTSISAPANGNSTTITIAANNPWTVSGTDWCTVSPSSGMGENASVTVTVKANNTYDARNCTLTFTSAGLSQSLNVSQESNYGIVLPKNTYEISSEAQQISVEVKANVNYDVTIDADWIHQSGTKALTSKTYVFSVAENTTYDAREGRITIKGQGITEVIKVKQAQKDAIIISSKEYNLTSDAQSLEIELQTNVDLDVVIPDGAKDWVSHTSTKALADKILIFSVAKNDKEGVRSCEISINDKNGSLSEIIKIQQKSSIVKDTSYSSMIVGTWKAYKMWKNSYWREIDDEIYLIFQKDGLCKYVESYNGTVYEDPYTWKINENQLFMDYVGDDDGVSDESKKRINLLTEEELIIEFSMPGEHWKEHFIRVK